MLLGILGFQGFEVLGLEWLLNVAASIFLGVRETEYVRVLGFQIVRALRFQGFRVSVLRFRVLGLFVQGFRVQGFKYIGLQGLVGVSCVKNYRHRGAHTSQMSDISMTEQFSEVETPRLSNANTNGVDSQWNQLTWTKFHFHLIQREFASLSKKSSFDTFE